MNLFTVKKNFTVNVFYASETGLSRDVANIFYNKIKKISINSNFDILNNFFNYQNQEGDLNFLFISTTNQGECPENGKKFFQNYKNIEGKNINYSIISFGDSSYDNFCIIGKDVNRVFTKIGAHNFKKNTIIDDQIDDNEKIEEMIENNLKYIVEYRNNLIKWFIKSMNSSEILHN